MRLPLALGIAACALVAGCNALTGEAVLVEPAVIVNGADTSAVSFPDTVATGTDFHVTITTYGGGCTREIARTDVLASADTILVRPLNRSRTSRVCPADFALLKHDVSMRITTAGSYTLRFTGIRRDAADPSAFVVALITRRFVVR